MVPRQDGHLVGCPPDRSARLRAAPHWGQYAVPSNRRAKQEGQLTVASRARQYSHRTAPGPQGAPQPGQRQVEAGSRPMLD
jgi:hypothetical protein